MKTKNKTKKESKVVRIPAEIHDLLKKMSQKEDRSCSAIVRRAVELYAEKNSAA